MLDEYKSQVRRAMKELMVEDLVYKKLSTSIMNSLKLNKMQFINLHTSIKTVREDVENAKEQQKNLFDQRLPTMTMLNMEKKLKEESKMVLIIEKIESMVDTMKGTLKTILDQNIHTNNILQKMR